MTAAGSLLQVLQAQLEQGPLQHSSAVAVAYSGGLDSHVLLHALSILRPSIRFTLRALHVHHGLSPNADAWQAHCEQVCNALDVPLTVQRVHVRRAAGDSLEEQARLARYAVFARELQLNENLLLAHHQDDQAETLLLRLMRGAGTRGLSAMPCSRPLGQGTLWRPLLELPRNDFEQYAQESGLQWIRDESNIDERFDRNFLRQRVLPLIAQRWPGYRQSWQRSAAFSAEAEQLASELAAVDLQQCLPVALSDSSTQAFNGCTPGAALDCASLILLSPIRQRNVLRHWLRSLGFTEPGWEVLRRCVEEVLPAPIDAQPLLTWEGQELRRYQNRLYALRQLRPPGPVPAIELHAATRLLELPDNGQLCFTRVTGQGLRVPVTATVVYREEGERCALVGRPTKPLKKILHEAGVPPWLRHRLPLLQIGGALACIPGIGVTADHEAKDDEPGMLVCWVPPG